MSIASEITRLQNAKASLKSVLESKGITVSSSATLDSYPALVNKIRWEGTQEEYDALETYDSETVYIIYAPDDNSED
jgi:hypothetical protein